MKIVVLGAAGLMGRVIARTLAERLDSEVVVADYNLDGAEQVVDWIGRPGVQAQAVDVTDEAALVRLIEGAGAVANAVTYYHNLRVMNACLKAGVPYADLGGLFHGTRKQLELSDAFAKAGVTAVVCIGSAPGITNMQARLAADHLERVESVRIYDGSVPFETEELAWGYSLTTIIDEVTETPFVFRGGQWVEAEPLGEVEPFHFRPPIGARTVHLSLHSEVATIPVSFADLGIQEVFFKIDYFGLSAEVIERLRLLIRLGLTSTQPITVGGATVTPRDVTLAVLAGLEPASVMPVESTREEIVTEARGSDAAGPALVTVRTLCHPSVEWGLDAGAIATASPIAIVCGWLASGRLNKPGVHAPETVVEARPLFEALEGVGLRTSVSIERPLAAT
jgi:saccharopine dehydrogenase-like NADP-dependent oxidoreductase